MEKGRLLNLDCVSVCTCTLALFTSCVKLKSMGYKTKRGLFGER